MMLSILYAYLFTICINSLSDEHDQTFSYFIIVLFMFLLNFNCSLRIYRYKSFMRQNNLQIFSPPVYGLSFHFLNSVFGGEDDLILISQ